MVQSKSLACHIPATREHPMFHQRLEAVALNGWPALQQISLDGWIIRFANGYTKRANSVNPLFESRMDLYDKIEICEQLYTAHDLSPIFRLTPFALPDNLDQILEQRNYALIDRSLVLYRDLRRYTISLQQRRNIQSVELDQWLAIFCEIKEQSLEYHQTHKVMLQSIASPHIFATLYDHEQPIACGVGVMEQTYIGLFDMVTAAPYRNQGYGAALVAEMLRWAQMRGAVHAYLQVSADNVAARHLYAKLGYQEVYPYWYRMMHPA